jgi:hypothetical protein
MQYILSEEEYHDLLQKKNLEFKIEKEKLQALCTTICDTMPITLGDNVVRPWGCILTKKSWYCDKCPVNEICPLEGKHWSK